MSVLALLDKKMEQDKYLRKIQLNLTHHIKVLTSAMEYLN